MKVLVTGSSGFVAGSILAQTPADWQVHAIGRSAAPATELKAAFHQVDLLDEDLLAEVLYAIAPDAVIHTAALANIDFCEQNQDLADRINVDATGRLAAICKNLSARLVFCSTDSIFAGEKAYYQETDTPLPLNHYARTKIRAEELVMSAAPSNIVARLSLVIGLPIMGRGNSFLSDMITRLGKGEQMKFAVNEIRTPVDLVTLGAALTELAAGSFSGTIHLAGNTRINRYEMALHIAKETGLPQAQILAVDSNALSGRAPRPNDVSLNNSLAKKVLQTPMLTLDEGLRLTLGKKFNSFS